MLTRMFYRDNIQAAASGEAWYTPNINVATEAGILNGVSVDPTAPMNRYEMALVMYNVMKANHLNMSPLSDTSKVADWAKIPDKYREAVSVSYNMGLLTGTDSKGTFYGESNMTRAQATVIVCRLLDANGGTQNKNPNTPVNEPTIAMRYTGDTYYPYDIPSITAVTDTIPLAVADNLKADKPNWSYNYTYSPDVWSAYKAALLAKGYQIQEYNVTTGIPYYEVYVNGSVAIEVNDYHLLDTLPYLIVYVNPSNTITSTGFSSQAVIKSAALSSVDQAVVNKIKYIEGITAIDVATETHDPNGNLNKAGGYISQVYFSYYLVNQEELVEGDLVEKGTDAGGSIETYATADEAIKRNAYLSIFDGSVFSSGSHTVLGNMVIRTSDNLTASQQSALEAELIKCLS